jgi:hypothetical protein
MPQPHFSTPACEGGTGGQDERRTYLRYESGVWTCFQFAPGRLDRACWPAVVRDLSVGGVALDVGCPLVVGSVLEFHLDDECRGSTRLLARVVRASPEAGGRWLIGCAFLAPLTEAQLSALLRGRITAGNPAQLR